MLNLSQNKTFKGMSTFGTLYVPLSIGQIWAIVVMPPAPKYCPIDTSSRKTGMPQNIMEMK